MFLYVFGFVKILCNGGFTRTRTWDHPVMSRML
nr:MAG TPA: hypothetical protein [Caudoviricetes sp.]